VDVRTLAGELIFSDDFSDPSAWSLATTTTGSAALGKKELTLAVSQPGGYLYSLRQKTNLVDFFVEITASPSLCKDSDEYGLLLRVSKSLEFYRFSITCDGHARLDRYFSGKASSPQPPIISGAIPPGAPSISHLAAAVKGKQMDFFVNGEHLFTVRDPSLLSGTLGVFARSNGETALTVNFSQLKVYKVK
jgi:hypothetical protein